MNKETEGKLKSLIGVPKIYNNKSIEIKSYKEVNQTIVVYTNRNTHAFSPSEIDSFFENLKESTPEINTSKNNTEKINTSDIVKKVSINGYQPTVENKILKTHLLSVLDDLKGKPTKETIEKSKAICNVANTLVNIQKTEIQLINTFRK